MVGSGPEFVFHCMLIPRERKMSHMSIMKTNISYLMRETWKTCSQPLTLFTSKDALLFLVMNKWMCHEPYKKTEEKQ